MSNINGADLRPLSRGYVRESAVIADIAALHALPRPEFWRRAAITDFQADGCPRLECLVYFVRDFCQRGDTDSAWRIVEILIQRVNKTIRRHLSRLHGLSMDQRAEIEEDLIVTLYTEWLSFDSAHEFWEARFGVCLTRKIIDAAKRRWRITEHEVQLTAPGDEEDSLTDPLANIADTTTLDPETATIVKQALAVLPEHERTTFYLRHHEGWSEEGIADALNVTSRTVRNYLRRAEQRLLLWRDEGMRVHD